MPALNPSGVPPPQATAERLGRSTAVEAGRSGELRA